MNIIYLCGHHGLDLDKMLGPKTHIQAILRGLKASHINPTLLAVQKSDSLSGYEEFETVILPHRYLRGFVHRILPYTGILNSLRVFVTIMRLNRTKHFALIHERYTGLSWGGLLAAKVLRIPYILQMVGPGIEEKALQLNPLKPSQRWLATLHQRLLLNHCSHCILNSSLIADFIYKRRGWRLPRYRVILNGAKIPNPILEKEKTAIRKSLGAENEPLLLYSGSLLRWYGTQDLVKAVHLAIKNIPKLKLVLIGSGDEKTVIKKYINQHQLSDAIILMDTIPQEELLKIIQAVDFCLVYYPGEPTYFGSSTKVIEYMALGKPVIASPHMHEIITDGITGFISRTADPEDFAAKIVEVVKQPDLAKSIGANARELILRQYTWDHYIDKLLRIYEQALKQTINGN